MSGAYADATPLGEAQSGDTAQAQMRRDAPTIGILVSGRGSNMEAIFAAIERGELRARVGLVISSRADAPALERARLRGAQTLVVAPRAYGSRAEEGQAIVAALREAGVELVALAGYGRVMDPCVVQAYPLRIVNIHPSLLPAFAGGMAPKVQAETLAAGVKIAGCTAHFVTAEVDAGPIIAQAAVEVRDDDTVETLAARILVEEHKVLPAALARVLGGNVRLDGRRVVIEPLEKPL